MDLKSENHQKPNVTDHFEDWHKIVPSVFDDSPTGEIPNMAELAAERSPAPIAPTEENSWFTIEPKKALDERQRQKQLEGWVIQHADDPEETFARMRSAQYFAETTGVDYKYVYENLENVTEQYYGEKKNGVSTWQAIKNAWKIGRIEDQLNELTWMQMNGLGDQELIQETIEALKADMPSYDEEKRSWPAKVTRDAAMVVPGMLDTMAEGTKRGLLTGLGAAGVAAVAGQLGPQAAFPEESLTVPGAAAIGYSAGQIHGSMESSMQKEAGSAYRNFVENEGMDPELSRAVAIGVGVASGLVEVVQLSSIPGLGQFFKPALEKAVKEFTFDTAGKMFIKGAGNYIGDVAANAGEEAIQEIIHKAGQDIAANHAGIENDPKFWQEMDEVADTAISSFQTFMLINLPGSVISQDSAAIVKKLREDGGRGVIRDQEGNTVPGPDTNTFRGTPTSVSVQADAIESDRIVDPASDEYKLARKQYDKVKAGNDTLPPIRVTVGQDGTYQAVDEALLQIAIEEGEGAVEVELVEGPQAQGPADPVQVTPDWAKTSNEFESGVERFSEAQGEFNESSTKAAFTDNIRSAFPNMTDREVNASVGLVDAVATVQGKNFSQYVGDTFAPGVFTRERVMLPQGKLTDEGWNRIAAAIDFEDQAMEDAFIQTVNFQEVPFEERTYGKNESRKIKPKFWEDFLAQNDVQMEGWRTKEDLYNRIKNVKIPGVELEQAEATGYKAARSLLEDGKSLIHLTETSDFSSWVHEYAHVIRPQLGVDDQTALMNHYGIKSWNQNEDMGATGAEEAFVRDLENYLLKGTAPTSQLRELFQRISEGLKKIYDRLGQTTEREGEQLPPEIHAIFDRIFKDDGQVRAAQDGADSIFIDNALPIFQTEAYHGSPYNFDEFSLEHIGAGEGAQAYGWGLYFTDKEDLAKLYADNLVETRVDGVAVNDLGDFDFSVMMDLRRYGGDVDLTIEKLNGVAELGRPKIAATALKKVEWLEANRDKITKDDRNLYGITLFEGEEETWLDWSEKFPQELIPAVKEELARAGLPADLNGIWESHYNNKGRGIYRKITGLYMGALGIPEGAAQKHASQLLNRAGIDGIRYPAGSMGHVASEKDYNYVVFNDKKVKIDSHVLFQPADPLDSLEFKEWFGESKIIDEDGDPLVVFHGSTQKELEYFSLKEGHNFNTVGDLEGFYFTPDAGLAYSYAKKKRAFGEKVTREQRAADRGRVYPVYLSIENPLNITDVINNREDGVSFGEAKREAMKAFDPESHDGVIFDGDEFNLPEYIAIEPEQIKSVENTGAWNREDPRILFQPEEREEIREYLDSEAIAETDGSIVPVFSTKRELVDWVDQWIKDERVRDIDRPDIGKITLTKRGVKNSISHGLTKPKSQGIVLLPEVISNGRLVHSSDDNGRAGHVIAAPVKIGDEEYIELAFLKETSLDDHRLYVHEVVLKEKAQGASIPVDSQKRSLGHPGLLRSIVQELYPVNEDPKTLFQEAPPEDSPAFQEWFGASKIVDESGKPLVVYHGTDADFEAFDISKGRKWAQKIGFWFSNQKDFTGIYGDRLVEAYLSIENPVIITSDQFDKWRNDYNDNESFWANARKGWIESGYDGLKVKGKDEIFAGDTMPANDFYVAFESTQIKSIKNNGTWNREDPRILFQGEMELDYDSINIPAEKVDVSDTEALAFHNAKVEIMDTLLENEIINDDILYYIRSAKNIEELDNTPVQEAWEAIGENRYFSEVLEDHIEDDEADYFEFESDLMEFAKLAKGTTEDLYEAGYALPDGTLLDFSGKRDGGPGGERAEDHRQLNIPTKDNLSGTDAMIAFQRAGAMRIDAYSGLVDIEAKPTSAQYRVMAEIFELDDGGILDMADGSRRASVDVENPRKVRGVIEKFYRGEEVPNTLFQPSGHEEIIRQAVEDYKPVPQNVLDEYKDRLWAQQEIKRREAWEKYEWLESLAKGFDSWEELKQWFNDKASSGDTDQIKQLGDDEADRFYHELWMRASFKTRDENNAQFVESYANEEGVTRLAADIAADRKRYKGAGIPGPLFTLAAAMGGRNGYTEKHVNAAIKSVKNNPVQVRRALAAVENDAGAMIALDYEDEIEEATPYQVKAAELPREERIKLALKTDDPELKTVLLTGVGSDGESLLAMEQAAAREIATLKAKQTKALRELEEKLGWERSRVLSLEENLKEKIQEAKDYKKMVELDTLEVIRETKAEIQIKDKKRRQILEAKEKMRVMGAAIQRRPSPLTCHVDYQREIQDLQALIEGKFRRKMTAEEWFRRNKFYSENPDAMKALKPEDIEKITKKPLNYWEMSELEDLHEKINVLRTQGRVKLEQQDIDRRKKTSELAVKMAVEIGDGKLIAAPDVPFTIHDDRYREWLESGAKDTVKMETWRPSRVLRNIGGEGSLLETYFWREMNKHLDDELKMKNQRIDGFKELMKAQGMAMNDLNELIYGASGAFSVNDVMHWYIVRDNEDNMKALMAGVGIEDITGYTEQLSPKHIALAEYIAKDFEDNYERYSAAFAADKNQIMGKVEGGYFPMRRVKMLNTERNEEIARNLASRAGVMPGTAAHHGTHSRIEISEEHQDPIKLGAVDNWMSEVEEQEHYINSIQYIREMHQILADPVFQTAMVDKHGKKMLEWLNKYANEFANPTLYKFYDSTATFSKMLRNNLAVAYLSFNMMTVAKQAPSLGLFMGRVGPVRLTAAAGKFMIDPIGSLEFVNERDPQMRERSMDRIMEELKIQREGKFAKFTKKYGEVGMALITKVDKMATTIGWMAVYDANVAQVGEEEAIRLAQEAVLETQPAARAKDLAQIYRSSEGLNWFLMFSNQINQTWNIVTADLPSAVKKSFDKSIPKKVRMAQAERAIGIVAGLMTSFAGIAALSGWKPWKEEEPEDVAKSVGGMVGKALMNTVPLIGGNMVSGYEGWMSTGVDPFPVAAELGDLLETLTNGEEDDVLKKAGKVAETAGVMAGIPVMPVKRGKRAVNALAEGEAGHALLEALGYRTGEDY